jgi:hypothetical protein
MLTSWLRCQHSRRAALAIQAGRADKLFASIEDEELLKEVSPGRNRFIYLLGHLAAMHDRMLVLLGIGERLRPEFDAVFLTAADKAADLPPVQEIRQ